MAIDAVAASILTAAYHILKKGTLYEDVGLDHFDKRVQGKQVYRPINPYGTSDLPSKSPRWRQPPDGHKNLQPL